MTSIATSDRECLQVCHILVGHTCLSELQRCHGTSILMATLEKTVIYEVRILSKMQKDAKKCIEQVLINV